LASPYSFRRRTTRLADIPPFLPKKRHSGGDAGRESGPRSACLSCSVYHRLAEIAWKKSTAVETAVENVLKAGYRTGDLLVGNTQGTKKVGTQEMGDAIVKELDRLA